MIPRSLIPESVDDRIHYGFDLFHYLVNLGEISEKL
jgi:hypothetical protein